MNHDTYQHIESIYQSTYGSIVRWCIYWYFKLWRFRNTKFKVRGLDAIEKTTGNMVIFSNHQAQEDSFVIRYLLGSPLRIMANQKQFFHFFPGNHSFRIFSAMGAVVVPDNKGKFPLMFEHVEHMLKDNRERIVVYAQGGRYGANETIRCKQGILQYLEAADCMTVMGLAGTHMPQDRTNRSRKVGVVFHIHPINDTLSIEELENLLEEARKEAQALIVV